MKNIYNKYVLPKLIHLACKSGHASSQREKIVPYASGIVLEIGIGSGLNLPFYDEQKVKEVIGIDPSLETWSQNTINTKSLGFAFEYQQAMAHDIPMDSQSVDTIVTTFTMCSIHGLEESFEELRRVLKPNGRLLFCEHGKAPDKSIRTFQNSINPLWKRCGGGCHLNRDIPKVIRENGFQITQMEEGYISRVKFASFNFWGEAKLL